ncbi:MAG TPA: hypothetical protein VNF99_13270 [Stellaceae bacterium]|nr:hypothetical protein [Stellaceae bacterium]
MSNATTMPHSVFSLRTSAFNDFLYAPIGEEENGMVLTALSALARLGVDPWDEAARLSELPKETAVKRLTSIVSSLPPGHWAASSARDIAARLTALLPGKQATVAQPPTAHSKHLSSVAMVMFLLICFANALAFSALRHHEPQPTAAQSAGASATKAPPHVPLP